MTAASSGSSRDNDSRAWRASSLNRTSLGPGATTEEIERGQGVASEQDTGALEQQRTRRPKHARVEAVALTCIS
jgi:hypothetical protein